MLRFPKTNYGNYCKLLVVFLLWSVNSTAQQPVDLFTGDLKYSIPIMTIPSPDGPPVPLVLNYNAGIRVEQKASWIGLGWSLNTGAIVRQINGVPDDWKGQIHQLTTYGRDRSSTSSVLHLDKNKVSRFYGPIHYNDFYEDADIAPSLTNIDLQYTTHTIDGVTRTWYFVNPSGGGVANVSQAAKDEFAERTMDTYTSYYPQEGSSFEFPDYDEYMISGPGISGKMKPFLFEKYGRLGHYPQLGHRWEYPFTETAHFRMLGEGNSILSPSYYDAVGGFQSVLQTGHKNWHYSKNGNEVSFMNVSGDFFAQNNPNNTNSYLTINFPSNTLEHITGLITGSMFMQGEFNANPMGPVITSDAYQGAISGNQPKNTRDIKYYTNQEIISGTNLSEFIEAPELTSRTSFEGSDIGAFSVTNTQGYTYHYSLPVYSVETSQFVTEYSDFNNNSATTLDSLKQITKGEQVLSWLLTAVTGPHYDDTNGDGIVNVGDKGHWVRYKYGKWVDDFSSQTPFYGMTAMFDENYVADYYGSDIKGEGIYEDAVSESQTKSKSAIWYLDYIQTASHTALFVKDIRKDEHSKPTTSSANPTPLLKLNKVVLMRTEDASTYNWNNASASLLNTSGFNTSNVNKGQVLHLGTYNQNNVVDEHILSAVVFNQDYSLAPNYHNNINTNVNTTSDIITPVSSSNWMNVLDNESYTVLSSPTSENGKLTLNEIQFLGFKENDYLPNYSFTYGANPSYNPTRVDYWGYYNSQGTVGKLYENEVNENDVDAWSLTQVTSPFSGITTFEYESDQYDFVGNERPMRMFRGTNAKVKEFAKYSNSEARVDIESKCYNFYQNQDPNNIAFVRIRFPFAFIHPQATIGSPNRIHAVFDQKGTDHSSIMRSTHVELTVPNDALEGVEVPYPWNTTVMTNYKYPQNYTYPDVGPYNPPGEFEPYYAGIAIGLKSVYGGGLRVKSITTQDAEYGGEYKINYTYENGAASNEPSLLAPPYAGTLLNNWTLYDRHNYSPNVGYGKVTVSSESILDNGTNSIDGELSKVYHFYNYNDKNVYPVYLEKMMTTGYDPSLSVDATDRTTWNDMGIFEIFKVEDRKTFFTGKLYKKEVLDDYDNVLSVTNTRYKAGNHTAEHFLSLNASTAKSRYYSAFRTPWGTFPRLSNYYANVVKSSAFIKDYRTQLLDYQTSYSNGVGTRFEILERDALTGIPTKTQRKSEQDVIITESRPAYLQYPSMGLKSVDDNNENFLNAISKRKVYRNDKLTSGFYHNFSKDMPVRKLVGGSYQTNIEVDKQWFINETYVFNGIEAETAWKLSSVATLFDERGNLLETRDDHNRFAAVKFGYDNRFRLASLGDGKYAEFTFSGAEDLNGNDFFGGEVAKGADCTVESTEKHTGTYSLKVPSSKSGFIYTTSTTDGLESGRTYKTQVWLKDNGNSNHTANLSYTYNGTTVSVDKQDATSVTAGDWTLLTLEIPIPSSTTGKLTIQCNGGNAVAYFDDFRFHPRDEPIQGYVYDPIRSKVVAILNAENFYSRLEYDELGNVTKTFRETLNGEVQVTESSYNINR